MTIKHTLMAFVVFAMMLTALFSVKATAADTVTSLDQRQQSIVTIAAFTASGDLDKLKGALNEGLDGGLTINESKEILVHLYAYAGFPRSLNAVFTLMSTLEERKAKGITDEVGKEASPVPADLDKDAYGAKVRMGLSGLSELPQPAEWQKFVPIIDVFLKEHLFADIFVRDILTHQERELATIGALANITGAGGQLRYHLGAAMNTGVSEDQMRDFVTVIKTKVGETQGSDAAKLLNGVLAARKK